MPGAATLEAEVTSISQHCIWILLGDEELAIAFSDFPWFKSARIDQILAVSRPTEDHLYWPELDIDISVASIRNPGDFPCVSKKPV
jgi:hypothetical protein